MNIVCDKTLLSAAIDGVSKAVTMRSSIPVLEGILLKAEGFQLIDEDVRQIVLAHGAGDGGAVRVGSGVDRNIFEQTFVSAHENRSPL